MKNKINISTHSSIAQKQRGATLFTALVFLALMTIVSVSAAKISMLDVLVSGSNQQEMLLYQKTDRETTDHTRPSKLLSLLTENNGETHNYLAPWGYDFPILPTNPNSKQKITNRVMEYGCGAIGGLATSQGSDNSCRLFDFEVKTKKANSGAKDRHARGAGKEYPSASRNNFNNN